MTERLSSALKQLPTSEIEKVADFAEFLASRQPKVNATEKPRFLKMDWAGGAAELGKEFASGVEAAHAAADMIVESAERKLRR